MSGFKYVVAGMAAWLLFCVLCLTTPAQWAEWLTPDRTQAAWELGSACFSVLNIMAIRKSRAISGIHWLPTAFFASWGVYNLWFYAALNLPLAWWAGLAITLTNLIWLGHVCYYARARGKS